MKVANFIKSAAASIVLRNTLEGRGSIFKNNLKILKSMKTEKIAMGINLRRNKIPTNSGYGKYYPEVDRQKTLSLRGFAQHMVDHGSMYTRGIVEGVLTQICDCLPELVAQGVPVQLGSLGTFFPTAEAVKGTGVRSIAEMDGLNPNAIVKAIHIRFKPDATKLDNLCGPAFKDACTLELRNIVDTKEVSIDGKTRTVKMLTPIATAVAEYRASQQNPGTGGESTGTDSGSGTGGSTEGNAGGSGTTGGSEDNPGSGLG